MVPRAQDNGPQEEDATLSLPSGIDLPFRTIQPEDVDALLRFHERLGERTIYLRFFGSMKELSEEKAKYLATVDGVDHVALVALDPEDSREIVAIVRYDREPEDEKAEYAALVEDRWQEHGVGLSLTRELIGEAKDNGVRSFYALVMGENKRMLELLRHLIFPNKSAKTRNKELSASRSSYPPKGTDGQDDTVHWKPLSTKGKGRSEEMAAFAFSLPILPGQEEVVRRMGEAVSESGELREEYEEPRRRLGIREEKVWMQRTPIGQAMIVYWETEDPQRTLREIADSQDEFAERFRELLVGAAPALDLSKEQPLSNELLYSWQAS